MNENGDLHGIGALARRTGVSVRTIRFWCDSGVVPATTRTAAGHRLYDARAIARVELVAALRKLGLGLREIRAVLEKRKSVADVAALHVRALDTEIRALRLQRAILSLIAAGGASTEETKMLDELARLSASERQRASHATGRRRCTKPKAWPSPYLLNSGGNIWRGSAEAINNGLRERPSRIICPASRASAEPSTGRLAPVR